MVRPSPVNKALLDTDVIINWLAKEEIPSGKKLWKAPYEIVKLTEAKKVESFISLLTLLEIRFVLRRKKKLTPFFIEQQVKELLNIFKVIIPDEVTLLRANKLQSQHILDPFDALLLALASTLENSILVSRDNDFLKIAKKHINVSSPDEFIQTLV